MYAQASADRLDGERLRRLIEAKSLADAFKMLGDYGFSYESGQTIDGFIVGETNRLIAFIEDVSPSDRVRDALTARFRYNNVKLAYKSRFTDVPSDGYYAVGDGAAIARGDYDDADKFLLDALTELDEAGEKRPQAIDTALTRAMYAYVLACGVPSIIRYFRAEIDLKNILAAARMRRLSINRDELVAGGTLPISLVESAITCENFAEPFEGTKYAESVERLCDEIGRAHV